MVEENSVAVEGVGGALLGMGTAMDWTKEDVGVHAVVLGDTGEVAGHFDSRNHVMTCVKRVCGLASGDIVRKDVSLLCHDGGQRK